MSASSRQLAGVALVSATLLMTELALTRIFSVVMYYHFAFLAISIALFGVSASGVFAYVRRASLARLSTEELLSHRSFAYAAVTLVALFGLVRLRVGLNYSPRNLFLMLTIYLLAALPFFAGGLVVTLAISRFHRSVNSVYAADLVGAAGGCLLLLPLLDRVGAPGVVLAAAAMALSAAVLFAPRGRLVPTAIAAVALGAIALSGQLSGIATFDVVDTKGHQADRILFSKWNSFSRVGVYERPHGDWSLSDAYTGPLPETRYMDIDSAASTPILHVAPDVSNAQYLKYELTAFAYHLKQEGGFSALVIGPGGGRDLVSALVFGARRVVGVEINPIIANDVMSKRLRDYSGNIYHHPSVHVVVDDGRSYIRRTPERFDVIQASLVDTWAATAAGAYTLTENTLYTVEAFQEYLEHLTDSGILTVTRWIFDGLRLVSLARSACEARGWELPTRVAVIQHDKIATFLLKKSPFTPGEIAALADSAKRLQFTILYAPGIPVVENEYAQLITAPDEDRFYDAYPEDIRPTTDDRPFFFHTTKLKDQYQVAFGRSMLFGNGLSALLTLLGISAALVLLFVIGPLAARGPRPAGWGPWLVYFGALGAGFMLIEVSVLQRFVLLLGHPVYSLTVTLFSLLLGTGLGAWLSGRATIRRLASTAAIALLGIAGLGLASAFVAAPLIAAAIPLARMWRVTLAVSVLLPAGMLLGIPMPAGIRLLSTRSAEMVAWAWGINGALSVLGATLAIFIAMNWGFSRTQVVASGMYVVALIALLSARAFSEGGSYPS